MLKPRTRSSILLGAFFQEQEARQILTTRGVHTPDELQARMRKWKEGRALFEAAPAWASTERVEVLDPPSDLDAYLADVAATDRFRSTVEQLPHKVAVVSLANIMAFQFVVDQPYCTTFQVPAPMTTRDLASITLPTEPPKFPVRIGGDGAGVVFTAPGPNLRIGSLGVQAADGGPLRMTVEFTFGSPFVQVAEFQGRFLLKNGYHRVVSLLTQGVSHAPVILLQCSTYDQTGATGPGFFAQHVVLGPKPPLLKHYLSPFAIQFDAAELHKTIRVRPDEFMVPIPE
jgi:hypothetical protein